MAGPIDPRLLRRTPATGFYLVVGVLLGSLTAVLTLGQAAVLSHSVADIFATGELNSLTWAVAGLAAIFAAKAGFAWANEWLAQRASAAVKSQLRQEILQARLERPLETAESGGLVTLVTQGLDGLDGYYSKYLPQLLLAVTVPVIVGIAILSEDLTSAIIVAVTLPLIPLFMALVGWQTEAITKRRWKVQTRLANHFADLVSGLPTLQVFGRAQAQAKALRETENQHRSETMRTLRVSFLSALVLELLATLSVALIAVTIGFRVVYGQVDLTTALFVLILAPEVYLPVRQVGVHYHDAADGLAAVESAFALIGTADDPARAPEPLSDAALLRVTALSHTYPGTAEPALRPTSFEISTGEVVALNGPSGAGKTTLLNAVMGFLEPTAGQVALSSEDGQPWREQLAYVGQEPKLIRGSVADNVRLGTPTASSAAVAEALRLAGAGELDPDQAIADDAEGVSAGERRRIAVARALLKVRLGRARLLILDEPTAGLDAATETDLLHSVRRAGVAALVVSHRPAVLAAADRVITLAGATGSADRGPTEAVVPAPIVVAAKPEDPSGATPNSGPAPAESRTAPAAEPQLQGTGPLLRRLFNAVPRARAQLAGSIGLASAATGASVALMAVSAWLLSRAAEMPPVLYLEAGAVGVRFFGISRGGFRYVERLASHDVALKLQSALRLETYTKLARTTLLGSRRGDLLARVIADVEAVQDLIVRVWIPFTSAALVIIGTAIGLAFFSPGSAAALLATAIAAAVFVPWLARTASARADTASVRLRGELADSARGLSQAATDLVAYGAAEAQLSRFVEIDLRLRRAAARSAWIRGAGTAVQTLAAGAAVIAGLVIGGQQVHDQTMAPVMLAVVVLTPLALHEALNSLIQAAQTRTKARAALDRVEEVLDSPPIGSGDLSLTDPAEHPALRVAGLSAGWPGAAPVVQHLDFEVAAGERVALVGPSGVGKTTVAATILGLIPALAGKVEVTGRVGYLAQDAHIFTTSIEENVRLGNRDADRAAVARALSRAGLQLDLDRIVGAGGDPLSGGEARRVALSRLIVGDYQVLILDEPTEHLDAPTAESLIGDIWKTRSDSPILVITHDPALIERCDRVIELAAPSRPETAQ